MRPEIKDLCRKLHEMGSDTEECVSLLQTSFIYGSSAPLNDCRRKMEDLKKSEPGLTRELTELARGNPDMKPYVSTPVHLVRIAESIEKLATCIEQVVKENVLFSDRAIEEITFLLQRLIDLMRPMSDIILARNVILGRYVNESQAGIVRRALEYATLHEERMVEGICVPVASPIYIRMLDEIKNIAWHANGIAVKLTSDIATAGR